MENHNKENFIQSPEYMEYESLQSHNRRLSVTSVISLFAAMSTLGLDVYKDVVHNSFTAQISSTDLATTGFLTLALAGITAGIGISNEKKQDNLLLKIQNNYDISNMNKKMLKRLTKIKNLQR